ncbi:MAG: hypothetical protein QOC81_2576 [Thermoanaerobaculia bacterium]|nr:hypothetical protein [Thermoanaerobaculia bacterium]
MKKVIIGCFVVAVLAVPTFVKAADTATGTLAVTGTVASSISLTVETGTVGPVLTGTTTNAASIDLGTTFSKYGTTPTGFTKTRQATTWTLASDFKVKVVQANSASATYTLVTNLDADPGTVTWTSGALPYVAVAAHNLTSTGAYGTASNYAWTIVIPDALVTPDLANTMHFDATAN